MLEYKFYIVSKKKEKENKIQKYYGVAYILKPTKVKIKNK